MRPQSLEKPTEPMCGKYLRKEPDKAFVSSVRLPGLLNDEADRRSEEPWLMGGEESDFLELYMAITDNSFGATEQRGSRSIGVGWFVCNPKYPTGIMDHLSKGIRCLRKKTKKTKTKQNPKNL